MSRQSQDPQRSRVVVDARQRVEDRWVRLWTGFPAIAGGSKVGPLVAGLVLVAAAGFALGYHRRPPRRSSSEAGEAIESY
ncbi:MAG: hypothetical protein OEM62_08280 [Acidobacteriota bacterium]|nr:hypothetical protein [Acidobacteriota bacterium]